MLGLDGELHHVMDCIEARKKVLNHLKTRRRLAAEDGKDVRTYFLMNFGVHRFFSCVIDEAFSSVCDIQMSAMVTIRDKPMGPES